MSSSLICKNSRLLPQYFRLLSRTHMRGIGFLGKENFKSVLLSKSDHRVIYEFRYIRLVGAYMGSKLWVPVVIAGTTPFMYYFEGSISSVLLTLFSAGVYFLVGIPLSKLTNNMVGKIYVNKEGDITNVVVSAINRSGRRIDRIHNVDDVINNDFPTVFDKYLGFIRLTVNNTDIQYKLNIYNCKYIDEDACDFIIRGIYPAVLNEKDKEIKNELKA